MNESGLIRIGELSRRSGVSPELLRAWERRYQLLDPIRSTGGLRLYSVADLERVQTMQRHLATGVAAAEAAALARQASVEDETAAIDLADLRRRLAEALAAFDEVGAHATLDSLLAVATLDTALSSVVIPYLHELGDRWQRGTASVAEEHFASAVLRGRLLGLARGWGRGLGPRALLACAPGEHHDLGLIAFGLALRARGWRIVYLGADTPLGSVADAAHAADPEVVVVSAVGEDRLRAHAAELRELARSYRLALGGAGAGADVGADVLRLSADPVREAERVTLLTNAPPVRL